MAVGWFFGCKRFGNIFKYFGRLGLMSGEVQVHVAVQEDDPGKNPGAIVEKLRDMRSLEIESHDRGRAGPGGGAGCGSRA